MPIPPQVNDRIKEAPALALRAVFAGIGQALLAVDRLRTRAQEAAAERGERPFSPHVFQPKGAPPAGRWDLPEESGTIRLLHPPDSPTTPAPTAPAQAKPAQAKRAQAKPDPAAAASAPVASPPAPVPGYDDLSVASLRARLRVLSPEQVSELIDYERSHAGRDTVISMFERRLAKLSEQRD